MKPPVPPAAWIEIAVGFFEVALARPRRFPFRLPPLALAIGAVKPEDASAIQALAVRFKAMLRALICRAR